MSLIEQWPSAILLRRHFLRFGKPRIYAPKTVVFTQHEKCSEVYYLLKGEAYLYRDSKVGKRQINKFVFAQDLVTFALSERTADSFMTATECQIVSIKHDAFELELQRNSGVATAVLSELAASTDEFRSQLFLVGSCTALQAVAGFILFLSKKKRSMSVIRTEISRLEMAEFLGLTIETTSRKFSYLRKLEAIEYGSDSSIIITNRSLLEKLAA